MSMAGPMLQDLRGSYIRREEPSFLSRWDGPIKFAALTLASVAMFMGLTWASLKYGEIPSSTPASYFPYITQVGE